MTSDNSERSRKKLPAFWVFFPAAALLAALARLSAGTNPFANPGLLWLSAASWSCIYLLVTPPQLFVLFRRSQNRRK